MVIDLSHVSWQRNKLPILQDISWRVQQGEHWALVGLNGSGKTTLLHMIHGTIWPSEGQIAVLGRRYGEVDLRELRKRIGWVSTSFQYRLHARERAEQIVLSGKFASIGLYEETRAEDQQHAHHLMKVLGCEHLVGRTYGTLSQGERQRILIARALMASPELLILDEPCTGLDLLAREQLLAMIEQIAQDEQGPTLIYVTHHIEEISPCFTHTFLLRNGKSFAQGRTSELLQSTTLSQFFETPVEVLSDERRIWVSLK